MIRFEWDPNKDHANRIKHRLSFETAVLVFDDPVALTIADRDSSVGEHRWQTIGKAGSALLVLVVHTHRDEQDKEVIRIISARRATPSERKRYEQTDR